MSNQKNKTPLELVRQLFIDAQQNGCLGETWSIVSALRGPDSGDETEKGRYTTPIRAAIFNKAISDELKVVEGPEYLDESNNNLLSPEDMNTYCCHYLDHIIMANRAINSSIRRMGNRK